MPALDPTIFIDIISGGGVIAFAWLVLRTIEKHEETFQKQAKENHKRMEEIIVELRDESVKRDEAMTQLIKFYREDIQSGRETQVRTQELLAELIKSIHELPSILMTLQGDSPDDTRSQRRGR